MHISKLNGVWLLVILAAMTLMCKSKTEKQMNLQSWLENKYPGNYVVVNKILDLDPKNLYYRKSTSIVGLKSNPDVQVKVVWYKDQPELGIDAEAFASEMEGAQQDYTLAKEISKGLQQQGVDKISVGVIKPAIYFLPFGEPTPETRERYVNSILAWLKQQKNPDYGSIWIEFLEDSAYEKHFKDIVPNGYWYRGDSWHDHHKIMSLDFEWTDDLTADQLKSGWKFNTGSNRSMEYLKDAYEQAQKWADQNMKKPFYLEGEQMIQLEPDEDDPLALIFSFPYFNEKMNVDSINFEEHVKGYVTGTYQIDQKTFSKIKKVKEL